MSPATNRKSTRDRSAQGAPKAMDCGSTEIGDGKTVYNSLSVLGLRKGVGLVHVSTMKVRKGGRSQFLSTLLGIGGHLFKYTSEHRVFH